MNESTCNIDCLTLFSAGRWIVWDNIGKEGFFHAVRNVQAVRGMDCSRDEWVESWGNEIKNQRREQGPSGNTVSPCLQFLCSCQKLQSPYPYQLLCLSQELQPSSPTPGRITPVPAVAPPQLTAPAPTPVSSLIPATLLNSAPPSVPFWIWLYSQLSAWSLFPR